MRPAWVLDLLLRHPDLRVEPVPVVGVRRRFPDRRRAVRPPVGDWRRVVLNRHLVDWAALAERTPRVGLTSVIIPTYEDSELTTACVESLTAAIRHPRTWGRILHLRSWLFMRSQLRDPEVRRKAWPDYTFGCKRVLFSSHYLPALQEWCTANGIVFIADEIQSGMARTGKYFASEHFGLVPDLLLSAKGIAGGLPLAGVTGRAEIMDASQPGGLGGTFGGNPVACAAAIAVFEAIESNGLLAEADRIGSTLKAGLERLKHRYDIIGDIRGKGAMIAIELVQPGTGDTTKVPNPDAVSRLVAYAAQHGVLFLSAGTWGNVLRFLPSLAVSDALIDDAIRVLDDGFASLG